MGSSSDFVARIVATQKQGSRLELLDAKVTDAAAPGQLWSYEDQSYLLVCRGGRGRFSVDAFLRLWQRLGWRSLAHMRGPMGGLLLDKEGGEVWAFRDLLGIIPLWWWRQGADYYVATIPDSFAYEKEPERVNAPLIRDFVNDRLDQNKGEQEFLRGLQRILPGELRLFKGQVSKSWAYWTPEQLRERLRPLRTTLHEAIGSVPKGPDLAATLSGGVDSSSVYALWREQHGNLPCVSIVSNRYPQFDERFQLAIHKSRWGGEMHYWWLEPHDECVVQLGPRVHPGWGPAFYPAFAYARAFFRWVKTLGFDRVLTGEGGDYLFTAGLTETLEEAIEERMIHLAVKEMRRLGLGRSKLGMKRLLHRHFRGGQERDLRFSYLKSWHWEFAVRFLDLVSRATGVELVHPLLDQQLWIHGLTLSANCRRSDGLRKSALRNALAGSMASSILWREKTTNLDSFFERAVANETPYIAQLLQGHSLPAGFMNIEHLALLLRKQKPLTRVEENEIWAFAALELWWRALPL